VIEHKYYLVRGKYDDQFIMCEYYDERSLNHCADFSKCTNHLCQINLTIELPVGVVVFNNKKWALLNYNHDHIVVRSFAHMVIKGTIISSKD
jgi:hypothetical protein